MSAELRSEIQSLKKKLSRKENLASRILTQRCISEYRYNNLKKKIFDAYELTGGSIRDNGKISAEEILDEILSIYKKQCVQVDNLKKTLFKQTSEGTLEF